MEFYIFKMSCGTTKWQMSIYETIWTLTVSTFTFTNTANVTLAFDGTTHRTERNHSSCRKKPRT